MSDNVKDEGTRTPIKPYKCNACNKSFSSNSSLQRHLQKHQSQPHIFQPGNYPITMLTENASLIYECDICKRKFQTEYSIMRHLAARSGVKPFNCELCGKGFITNQLLELHFQNFHEDKCPFKCSVCKNGFPQQDCLWDHIINTHTPVTKPFKCKVCNKGFSLLRKLKLHQLVHSKERPFHCPKCNKTFKGPKSLRDHMYRHKEYTFPCQQCGKVFKLNSDLTQHHKQFHSGEGKFVCQHCSATFFRKTNFQYHLRRSHESQEKIEGRTGNYSNTMSQQHIANTDAQNPVPELGKRRYVCERCSRRFGRNYHLKCHLKIHERRDKFKKCLENVFNNVISHSQQKCQNLTVNLQGTEVNVNAQEISDEALKSQDTLEISKALTVENAFKCPICEKTFSRKSIMRGHINFHNGIKPHICNVCNDAFSSNQALSFHVKNHSTEQIQPHVFQPGHYPITILTGKDDRRYECNICKKEFRTEYNIMTHLSSFTGMKAYNCKLCGKGFFTNRNLESHFQAVHKDECPFKCSRCKMGFPQQDDLKNHIISIHTLGSMPFKCKDCNKGFKGHSQLKIHMRKHTNERPFTCNKCNKKFKSCAVLRLHLERHNVPTLACQQCDKVFKVKVDLARHHKIHEGEKSHVCQRCSARFVIKADLQRHVGMHERRDKIEECLKNDFNEISQLQQQCHNRTVNPQETEVNVNAQEITVEALKIQDTLETSKTLIADNKDSAYNFVGIDCQSFSTINASDWNLLGGQEETARGGGNCLSITNSEQWKI